MTLYSKIQDYFSEDDLKSLHLNVIKKEGARNLGKDDLLQLLATQDISSFVSDVQYLRKLLADKGVQKCNAKERLTLYDDVKLSIFYRGEVEMLVGEGQEAKKYFLEALTGDDIAGATRAATKLGHIAYSENNLNQAEVYYKQAIEKNDPTRSGDACIALGNLYCTYNTTECYGWAEQCYKKAMTFENPETTAKANLLSGHLYIVISKPERAKIVYERAAQSPFEEIATVAKAELGKLTLSGPTGIDGVNPTGLEGAATALKSTGSTKKDDVVN